MVLKIKILEIKKEPKLGGAKNKFLFTFQINPISNTCCSIAIDKVSSDNWYEHGID